VGVIHCDELLYDDYDVYSVWYMVCSKDSNYAKIYQLLGGSRRGGAAKGTCLYIYIIYLDTTRDAFLYPFHTQ
jgi:hypothetical protein